MAKTQRKVTFAQICKVDEVKRIVYGIATEEVPDHEDEIFDYDTSKAYFQEWSANAAKVTDGKSKGAIRYMHQLDAVGKVVALEFDDTNKRILVGAKIVDDSVWTKIVEGVLTGFSIGGRALKRWADGIYTRFTVKPVEISVVDVPCCPTAVFEYMKADGSVESREFKTKEVQMPDSITEFGSEIKRVWADIQALKKAAGIKARKVGDMEFQASDFAIVKDASDPTTWVYPVNHLDVEEAGEVALKLAKSVAADKEMLKTLIEQSVADKKITFTAKSMSSICDMVYVLQSLYWVRMDAEWEAAYENGEGDPRDAAVAAKLRVLIDDAVQILKDVVEEETAELSASNKAAAGEVGKNGPGCVAGKEDEKADDDGKDKEPDSDSDDEEDDGKKEKPSDSDKSDKPESADKSEDPKTDKTAAACGQEGEQEMNKEEILKAIQDAIAALDLKKAVADVIAEQGLATKADVDAVKASVPEAVTAEVDKVKSAMAEPKPVLAIPRVQKTEGWSKVTNDEDCGL